MNPVNRSARLMGLLMILMPIGLTACINVPHYQSEHVQILWQGQQLDDCQLKGPIIGSQGHWYDYLFISNKDLTQGAINQLRNEALTLGANTVYLLKPQSFTTSVTILGNAYNCSSAVDLK
ncbi:DUF4156 domain-containing protein [Pseudomonadota bacterium]|uniref:DUF4156 domain-containing protein n=1 Tax=unclassified Shewanella TaxID=196818 RepID=UPI0026E1FA2F|nr:DUF4156 domain-containing protein [Shewanella sp. 4_MG-2023]MDO6679581.1 DUF4156 domain-containing protein [Shewanella sp. 4_MG-2023]